MTSPVATLAIDVTAAGLAPLYAGMVSAEVAAERLQKRLDGTGRAALKLGLGLFALASTSAIASAFVGGLVQELGYFLDSILEPIAPALDITLDLLAKFNDWFAEQGPVIKSIALGLALAFGLMWLGVSGPIAVVIAAIAAFVAWFSQQSDEVQVITLALAAAFAILWFAATGGIGPLIAALAALVVYVVQHWDDIKAAFKSAIDWILNLLQPLIDAVKWVADNPVVNAVKDGVGAIGSAVGGALGIGGGGSSSVSTSSSTEINNFNVTAVGSASGGRDAGLSIQQQQHLARRVT